MQRFGRFAVDSVTIAIGTAVAQAVLLGTTPILSRAYGPAAFGEAATIVAITTVLSVISTGRYELAVLLPEERAHGLAVVILCLLVATGLAALAALAILVASRWHPMGVLQWALPLAFLSTGGANAFTYWILRERAFTTLAAARVASAFVTVTIQLAFAFAGERSATGLVLGTLVGPFVVALLGIGLVRRARIAPGPGWKADVREVARRYHRFPLVESLGALIGTSGLQLPVLLLTSIVTPAQLGQYSMASRLLTAPVSFMGSAIGQVFFQRASERVRNGGSLWTLTWSLYRRLLAVGVLPYMALIATAPPLFPLLLGHGWSESGVYARYLAPAALFQLTFSPLSTLFAVRGRQGSAFIVHLTIFLTPVVAILGGRALFGPEPVALVATLGLLTAVSYFGLSMWNLRLARHAPAPSQQRRPA